MGDGGGDEVVLVAVGVDVEVDFGVEYPPGEEAAAVGAGAGSQVTAGALPCLAG